MRPTAAAIVQWSAVPSAQPNFGTQLPSPTSDTPSSLFWNSGFTSPALSSASSPALSSAERETPTPEPSKPSRPDSRGKGRGHAFTRDQETYIAELLADLETWALLDGLGEKNNHYKPKAELREAIAKKVNSKFSTNNGPVYIDGLQIKNRIENMKRTWKKANKLLNSTGNGDRSTTTLRDKVLDVYPGEDNNGDTDEEDSTAMRHVHYADVRPQELESRAPKSKRRRDTGADIFDILEELSSNASEERDLKRKKLELEKQKIELDKQNAEAILQ
ncbi:hypothetical protein BG011_007865 [Mortierella polycephala]|uniref:Myb/SANT-like domain-containing protein n=1 Tax=Mortierella polycephala TaxID=41804 RepID=A0A9P6PRC5_9FUNG|nr:hypothetical protein BG011_007865 [Mortierella polycephala]